MKTRNGFISNSSSTSFCICGYYLEKDYFDIDDNPNLHKLGIESYHSPNDDDAGYIGISIDKMEDSETLSDFKERCGNILKELDSEYFQNCKPNIIYDGWYDG